MSEPTYEDGLREKIKGMGIRELLLSKKCFNHLDFAGNIKGAGLDASKHPDFYLSAISIYNRLEVEKELMRKRYWSQIPRYNRVVQKYNHNKITEEQMITQWLNRFVANIKDDAFSELSRFPGTME